MTQDIDTSKTITFYDTMDATRNLLTWDAGWNGYTAMKPDQEAIYRAMSWLRTIHSQWPIMEMPWGVTSDGMGAVVYEWWGDHTSVHQPSKKITVYIEPNTQEELDSWLLVTDTSDPKCHIYDGPLTFLTWPAVWCTFCGEKLPFVPTPDILSLDDYYDLTKVPIRIGA